MNTNDAKLRALVVDDEPLAGRRLARQLERLGLAVTAVLASGAHAVARAGELAFDVAFLDIEMPGIDGLETAARLTADTDVAIVFVTAHDHHALAAFDVGAIDYVLKPISAERLQRALHRLGPAPARTDATELVAASARLEARVEAPARRVVRLEVRTGTKTRYVDAGAVQRLYAADKYVMFTDGHGIQHVLDDTLTQLELRLAPLGFVRVHRRELIRLDAVASLSTRDRATIATLANGERAQVSRRLAPRLKALLVGRA